jgi:membrane protease YdiL (CAAX protease family)
VEVPSERSVRRQGLAWLGVAAGGFLGGQVFALVVVEAVAAALGHRAGLGRILSRPVVPAWAVTSELVGLWCGLVAAVVVASRLAGTGSVTQDMGLRFTPLDVLIGLAAGLAGQMLLIPLLYAPLGPLVPHLDRRLSAPARHLTQAFSGSELAVLGLATVVVVPVVEELFFRGLLLGGLRRALASAGRVGTVVAVVADGVLFGLAHAESLQLLGLAAFGMLLAGLRVATGRLGPSILAHATFNFLAVAAASGSTTGWLR